MFQEEQKEVIKMKFVLCDHDIDPMWKYHQELEALGVPVAYEVWTVRTHPELVKFAEQKIKESEEDDFFQWSSGFEVVEIPDCTTDCYILPTAYDGEILFYCSDGEIDRIDMNM